MRFDLERLVQARGMPLWRGQSLPRYLQNWLVNKKVSHETYIMRSRGSYEHFIILSEGVDEELWPALRRHSAPSPRA